ncbi:facilitated trehalose transporter Tret1-like [Arctopsyche grandis]|uniref:facilitated trehalose transporter Tret1-like n=1 Tax=Arctopsyche grandis TaxID=121162 RepID=UPI00406D7123
MTEQSNNNETGKKIMQYVAAASANLGILALGMCLGWTSPTIPKLKDPDNTPLNDIINDAQDSWIASLIALGAAISPLYSGIAAAEIGRKWSILAGGIPLLVGWILIATAKDVGQIYAARVIIGLSVGQLFTVIPMYVGEIAESDIRGALGSFLQMFIVIGFLLTYVIGPYVSYLALSIISMVPGILFMIIFFFMPESPIYLLSKNQRQAAQTSLERLRGKTAQGVQEELDDIQKGLDQNTKKASFSDLWTPWGNFKALYLSCGLVLFQQFSGINVVLFYLEPIFGSSDTGLSPEISTIIIGVVQVLASSVTPLVVDRVGRRILLIISSLGMTVALALLGLFFILDAKESSSVESITWLPIASLVLFMCVYCIGFGPLPWAVMGELFDPSVKSIASTIATTFCWLISFILTKFFGSVADSLGMHYAFWIFGLFTLIAFFFVFFLLPETKGKSLQEIQDILNK